MHTVEITQIDDKEWVRSTGKVKHLHVNTASAVGFWNDLNGDVELLGVCKDVDGVDIEQPIAPIMCYNLRVLVLSNGMHMTSDFVRCLPPQLSELYVDSGTVDKRGVDFSSMRCLTHLSLDDCGITRIGGFVFPKRAFHLDLSNNVIDLSKLRSIDKIIALSLRRCVIRHLSRWVIPATLEELDLGGTGIGHIRELPSLPRGLRKLDLSGNELKNMDGWVPNFWLDVLDIGNNQFSDFPVIKANPHLSKLVLDDNDISDGDLYRLYTMVTHNTDGSHVFKIVATPTEISVEGCRLSETSMVIYDAVAELVARNEGPEELDEYLHVITCLTVLRCAASIPHNVPVRTFPLDLCKCLKTYLFKE